LVGLLEEEEDMFSPKYTIILSPDYVDLIKCSTVLCPICVYVQSVITR